MLEQNAGTCLVAMLFANQEISFLFSESSARNNEKPPVKPISRKPEEAARSPARGWRCKAAPAHPHSISDPTEKKEHKIVENGFFFFSTKYRNHTLPLQE